LSALDVVGVVGGQNHEPRVGPAPADRLDHPDAVEHGHLEVDERHVGSLARVQIDRGPPVTRLADHRQPGASRSTAAMPPRTMAWSSAMSTRTVRPAPALTWPPPAPRAT
jgi:hypothetical protein